MSARFYASDMVTSSHTLSKNTETYYFVRRYLCGAFQYMVESVQRYASMCNVVVNDSGELTGLA